MSRLRKPTVRHLGSAWERIWSRVGGTERRAPAACKHRRLLIDQLEERTLLSISAAGVTDQLINQGTVTLPAQLTTATNPSLATQAMVTGKSVATDNNGDFVVVWAQNDGVYDANGNAIIDPNTGLAMSDDNVYARYFTDAMQRLDIPTGISSFQIHYGGDEIQKLTISADTQPYQSVSSANNVIAGYFTLTFGGYTTGSIAFSESANMAQNATNIQTALRALGNSASIAALQDITVQAIDADDYQICFGGKSNSLAQPLFTVNAPTTTLATAIADATTTTITVANASQFPIGGTFAPFTIQVGTEQMLVTGVGGTGNTTWTVQRGYNQTVAAPHVQNVTVSATSQTALSGLLPVVTASAVRTPGTITVPVSNSSSLTAAQNMAQTAQNIQYAFAHTTSEIVYTAPYTFPPDNSVSGANPLPNSAGPYYQPLSVPLALPAVSVTARSATEFDITFTGDEGYNEQPTLQVLDTSNQQVQQIQFTPNSATTEYGGITILSGSFVLITGKGTTTSINFNSSNLPGVASQVKAALVALGYSSATSVTFPSNTTPFTMTITWSSADTASGVIPLLQCSTSMAATVTVSYGDGKPLAGATVQIIKESSDAFRVNDPEPVWDPAARTARSAIIRTTPRWRWTPTAISSLPGRAIRPIR